jgi:hypothetical protein
MHRVCGHDDVGQRLSIEGIRVEISWVWNPTAYKAFLAMLSGVGNSEACFLFGIKAFIEHRGYNDLRHTVEGGHDAAAYLYAILLYRDNGGTAADDTAKGYMRRVAGGGSTTSLLTDKRRIHLRSASVRTYTFFTTGFPRFLSIREARVLQAFDLLLLTNYSNPI